MSVEVLLDKLAEQDVRLYLDDAGLRFRAPAGAMTDRLRREISDHRAEIVRRLRTPAEPDASPQPCVTCDRRYWIDKPVRDGRIRTTCGRCGRFIGYRPARL